MDGTSTRARARLIPGLLVTLLVAIAGTHTAPAAPDWTAAQASGYVNQDLPQQFAWRHSGDVTAALPAVATGTPVAQTAGEGAWLNNLRLSLDNHVSYEKDELLFGRGLDANSSLYATMQHDDWQFGLGLTYNNHHNYGEVHLRQDSQVVDLFALYEVLPNLHLGAFADVTASEVARRDFTWEFGQGSVGGDHVRLGAGLLASYQYVVHDYTLTLTSSLASMNKEKVPALWSLTYTSWATMLGVHRALTRTVGMQVYASYLQLLAGPSTLHRDMNFVTVGTEFDYQVSRRCTARVGYERTLLYHDFENHAVTLGVDLTF